MTVGIGIGIRRVGVWHWNRKEYELNKSRNLESID